MSAVLDVRREVARKGLTGDVEGEAAASEAERGGDCRLFDVVRGEDEIGAFRGNESACVVWPTGLTSKVEVLPGTMVDETSDTGGEGSRMISAGDSGTLTDSGAGGTGDFGGTGLWMTSLGAVIPERVRPLNNFAKCGSSVSGCTMST